ncbi:helicase RepA family protein [Halomonas sp. ANAO-440]|uniref:helicase RepA family protein n=1 Tax=Halomonas sp. ANAO-440 TaxID=2861360 RepID=UPI001CAA6A35|nr:helicase RepA family protein [Halomonas sp. ANAO-440]MBZ0330423.1 helicase RepA family protein [Halomonas sp. ANAO-440]
MTAAVLKFPVNLRSLPMPRAFREAEFCSGLGQHHSPTARRNPRPLQTITGAEVVEMLEAPQCVDKAQARWAIFSDYPSRRAEDQRQHGRFYALWADLDSNPPQLQDAADSLAEDIGSTVLAYTSASATPDNPKARLVIPLNVACPGGRFEACQRILNDRLEALGIVPDRVTERPNQLCYLPNRGQFFAATVGEDAEDLVGVSDGFDWEAVFASELTAHDKAEAERLVALDRWQAEARAKLAERHTTGQASPIVAYNAAHPLPLVLEAYGYRQHGPRWLSPLSESGTPGVSITKDGARWHTAHESDIEAGLPEWGDAFDLLTFWEHDGDRDAALRAVGDMMTTEDGRTLTEFNQDRYRESRQQGAMDALTELDNLEASQAGIGARPRRSFGFTPVGELVASIRPVSWLVRGYVEADSLALVYGEPGHGKSFLTIDLAASIATGTPWHGAETKPGPVFYIAGEGQNGIGRRFKAWAQHREASLAGVPLYISERAAPLDEKESAGKVLEAVDALAADARQAPALIVVDTLARCFAGDENSATDIGAFVANLDALRHRWRATVLVVHHSGKDSTRGARGSTALRGAVDAEYRVTKDHAGTVTLEPTKMKDADMPDRLAFSLEPVELKGIEGEESGSCILKPMEDRAYTPKRPKGKHPRRVLEVLENLAALSPDHLGAGCRVPVEECRRILGAEGMDRRRFLEAMSRLAELGWVVEEKEGMEVLLPYSV